MEPRIRYGIYPRLGGEVAPPRPTGCLTRSTSSLSFLGASGLGRLPPERKREAAARRNDLPRARKRDRTRQPPPDLGIYEQMRRLLRVSDVREIR